MAGLKAGTAAVAVALAVGGQAAAQEADGGGSGAVVSLGSVTVTATRTPSDVFSVPSTVTVIDAEEIEEALATDIKDLIRFEPGVSVPTSPSRFGAALASTGRDGNSGFTIRGMGGNRVLFQVDGVRVPDGFSFGPAAFGRGDRSTWTSSSRSKSCAAPPRRSMAATAWPGWSALSPRTRTTSSLATITDCP